MFEIYIKKYSIFLKVDIWLEVGLLLPLFSKSVSKLM